MRLPGIALKVAYGALAVMLLPHCSPQALAQDARHVTAQLQRGKHLAEEQCSACHIVEDNQENPPLLRDPAPSFASIANGPQGDAKALSRFIRTTHWDLKTVPITMPNPELSQSDANAVIQYILSLKKQR